MREFPVVVGKLPYLPAKSAVALCTAVRELTALVTREPLMVAKTRGTITTARIAMIASTPIISMRLNPDWRFFMGRGGGSVQGLLSGVNRPHPAPLAPGEKARRILPTWV